MTIKLNERPDGTSENEDLPEITSISDSVPVFQCISN